MKIVIKRIGRKEVSTKDGMKFNMSILGEDGTWYSGWPSDATKEWKEGSTIDVDVSERTVGDRTYKNFKPKPVAGAPAASSAAAWASSTEIVSLLKEMVVYLKLIATKDDKKPKAKKEETVAMDEPPPHSDDDAPPPVEEEQEPF